LIKFGFQNIFPNTKTEKDKKIGKGKKKDERNQAGQMASQSQINKVATHTRAYGAHQSSSTALCGVRAGFFFFLFLTCGPHCHIIVIKLEQRTDTPQDCVRFQFPIPN
jgi:hypothetical protein